jgi:hypothetical protein
MQLPMMHDVMGAVTSPRHQLLPAPLLFELKFGAFTACLHVI